MKRPLVPMALCYVAGILLANWTVSLPVLFAVAFALLTTALAWSRARPFLLAALLVLAGWVNLEQCALILSPHDLRDLVQQEQIVNVRGLLFDTPQTHLRDATNHSTISSTAQLEVTEISADGGAWAPAFGRVATFTHGALPKTIFAGQTVEITEARIGTPALPVAEGLLDYAAHLRNSGIDLMLDAQKPEAWRVIASPARPPLADRFSAWARDTLARGLPEEDETLWLEWKLTLGWKGALIDDDFDPFIKAATYHIFAVDGLRIAIISGILIGLLRVVGVPRVWCGLLAMPLICCYAAMTGWPASAIRAIAMISVVFVGWALERPSDLVNSLAAAALAILLWDPRELFQAGFQLSFFVVLCIILILPVFEQLGRWLFRTDPFLPDDLRPRWQKFLRTPALWITDLLLVSVAAWLGSIPLVALYFHIFTPLSGPANVLAVPLCALVLIANLSSLLLATWLPFAAELFNHAGWFCMRCIQATSQWSANWPAAYYYVRTPGWFSIGLYYAILLTLLTGWLFKGRWRAGKVVSVALLSLIWCGQWLHQRAAAQMTILPLEGGSAIYVQGPVPGNEWLIDCGNPQCMETVVKPFLRAQGVNGLSNLILTHGEMGYSGGAEAARKLLQPACIYTSSAAFRSTSYGDFLNSLKGVPEWMSPLKLGDSVGPWTVLHPAAEDHFSKGVDNALVLRGKIDGTWLLLLSDLGRPGQRALLERTNDLRADIAIAGIPPEGEPLGDLLLDAVQPRVIIIADTEHPAERKAGRKLRERLAGRNVPVIYESDSEAVTLEFRPGRWNLRAMDGTKLSGEPEVWKP